MAVLNQIRSFSPFGFDAAGFLTLLGADQVNQSVGRFVRSKWLEYMPFLAPYVLASNAFLKKQSGYTIYNITEGDHATNLAAWFTRFLTSHENDMGNNLTVIKVDIPDRPYRQRWEVAVGLSLAATSFGILFALCVLAGDWFGFASTTGILISVLVRVVQIEKCRGGLHAAIRSCQEANKGSDVIDKVLIVDPDDKVITIFMPRALLVPIFIKNPSTTRGSWHGALRNVGWVAFLVQIIALNSATFLIKLLTSVWMVGATVLYVWKLGCEDSSFDADLSRCLGRKPRRSSRVVHVGSMLRLELTEWPASYEFTKKSRRNSDGSAGPSAWTRVDATQSTDRHSRGLARRRDVYAWLNLTWEEEQSMAKWDLFPHMRSDVGRDSYMHTWWEDYNEKKALIAADPWHIAATKSISAAEVK